MRVQETDWGYIEWMEPEYPGRVRGSVSSDRNRLCGTGKDHAPACAL